jgi:archaemetzincin
MDHQNIILISFGFFEEDFLNKIANAVKVEYPFRVNIKEGHIDLSEYYDPVRRQYDGIRLLKEVDHYSHPILIKQSDYSVWIFLFQS